MDEILKKRVKTLGLTGTIMDLIAAVILFFIVVISIVAYVSLSSITGMYEAAIQSMGEEYYNSVMEMFSASGMTLEGAIGMTLIIVMVLFGIMFIMMLVCTVHGFGENGAISKGENKFTADFIIKIIMNGLLLLLFMCTLNWLIILYFAAVTGVSIYGLVCNVQLKKECEA